MPKAKFEFAKKTSAPKATTMEVNATDINLSVANTLQKENNACNLETKLIPRHKIKENPKNKAPMTSIPSLMDSILKFGLQQPLVVIYSSQQDEYIIETGHRRALAIDNLISKYKDWEGDETDSDYINYKRNVMPYEKGYPCTIKEKLNDSITYDITGETDEELDSLPEEILMSEIRILITNNEVRSESDPENQAYKQYEVTRLAQLYDSINRRRKRKDKIKVNETIADKMGISPRQVIKYKNVDTLIPELQEAFRKNDITLTEADSFHGLSEEVQHIIVNMLESGVKLKADEAKKLQAEKEALQAEKESLQEIIKEKTNSLTSQKLELLKLKTEYDETKSKISEEIDLLREEQAEKEAKLREQLINEAKESGRAELEKEWEDKINSLKTSYQQKEKLLNEKLQNADTQLQEKEKNVSTISSELQKLKEDKAKSKTDIDIIKADTELKTAYENALTSLSKFNEALKKYSVYLPTPYMSKNDIDQYIKTLTNKITS